MVIIFKEIIEKYKKIVIRTVVVMALLLAIPTVMVLCFGKKGQVKIYDIEPDGRVVVIEDDAGNIKGKMDVEEFLPCAIAGQLDVNSEEELLKAFAVILRTYINNVLGDREEVSVKELQLPYVTYDEMQESWKEEFTEKYNKLNKVVVNTAEEKIYCNEMLILPYFHGVSSGKTRNADDVFGEGKISYLKSVASESDILSENYLSMKYYTYEEFADTIVAYRESVVISKENPLEVISVVERDEAGYVKEIQIGSTLFTGDEFMECCGLNSPNFQIDDFDGGVRIIVKGNGHGLGLSLYGAKIMAESGASYKEILLYYYNGVEIVK